MMKKNTIRAALFACALGIFPNIAHSQTTDREKKKAPMMIDLSYNAVQAGYENIGMRYRIYTGLDARIGPVAIGVNGMNECGPGTFFGQDQVSVGAAALPGIGIAYAITHAGDGATTAIERGGIGLSIDDRIVGGLPARMYSKILLIKNLGGGTSKHSGFEGMLLLGKAFENGEEANLYLNVVESSTQYGELEVFGRSYDTGAFKIRPFVRAEGLRDQRLVGGVQVQLK